MRVLRIKDTFFGESGFVCGQSLVCSPFFLKITFGEASLLVLKLERVGLEMGKTFVRLRFGIQQMEKLNKRTNSYPVGYSSDTR